MKNMLLTIYRIAVGIKPRGSSSAMKIPIITSAMKPLSKAVTDSASFSPSGIVSRFLRIFLIPSVRMTRAVGIMAPNTSRGKNRAVSTTETGSFMILMVPAK